MPIRVGAPTEIGRTHDLPKRAAATKEEQDAAASVDLARMSIALDVGPVSVRTSTQHAVHAAAAIALRSARAGLGLVFGDRALRRAELELAARARAIDRARQRGAARWWVRVFVLASWLCRRGAWLLCHALGRAIAPTSYHRILIGHTAASNGHMYRPAHEAH